MWGHLWKGSTVLVHCDNAAVVEVISCGKAKDPHKLWAVFYISAYFDVGAHPRPRERARGRSIMQ